MASRKIEGNGGQIRSETRASLKCPHLLVEREMKRFAVSAVVLADADVDALDQNRGIEAEKR
jgi:hypothetical protein